MIRGEAQVQEQVEAVAIAYRPVVRGYLLGVGLYYLIITGLHLVTETGWSRMAMAGLAAVTTIVSLGGWNWLRRRTADMHRLELSSLAINALVFANVALLFAVRFEPQKLIYFVLIALAFATAGPTRRVVLPSVAGALATMLLLALQGGPDLLQTYFSIGLAGAFTAVGMGELMRGSLSRQVRERLAWEAASERLEAERLRISELQAETHNLAVAAQTASRAKSEFLSTISHELRTPLHAILGLSHALETTLDEPSQVERVRTIRAQGRALQKLINDLIDISNLEASRLDLCPVAFDLGKLADDLQAFYGDVAGDKGLSLDVRLEAEARGWCHGDDVRLRQILSNLISNAIRFTERGAVAVTARRDADVLTFSVADTGIGVDPAKAERMFDRFVQADASSTRPFGGAGLGLAICKELVDLMGGHIGVTSELGHGACFTFDVVMPSRPAPAEATTSVVGEPARPLKVLVVDDNHINRLVLQTFLSQLGANSSSVENGRRAVAAWEAEDWDAVLMDIHMPEMDGVAATREIRTREAASGRRRTPVVAVTASVLVHETQRYLTAGMDAVAAKPVDFEQLAALLERLTGEASDDDKVAA